MQKRQSSAHISPTAASPVRLCGLMLLALVGLARADSFGSGLDNSEWLLEANPYFCQFYQPIPQYGLGVFFHEAGRELEFYLEASQNLMAPGHAALTVEAPPWRSSALTSELGYIPVVDSRFPLWVEPDRARRMMAELYRGMAPTFTRQAKSGSGPVRVRLSPVEFRDYYNDYLACATGLLPVNFSQIERTVVNYPSGGDLLSDTALRRLDNLITYVLADDRVLSLDVVGHSDNIGERFDNRRLSERRAYRVTDYLVNNGVDPTIIRTDYQGDRYPIADNATAEGRAANRRTTVLVRRLQDDPDDPLRLLPDLGRPR
ncbi:MAG: OmpA family protein [Saccharospirillum sp.]|nr:OmpA family protein [Saccharospirillum sp.]